jgi:predicted RNase H-like HicB family nuclease
MKAAVLEIARIPIVEYPETLSLRDQYHSEIMSQARNPDDVDDVTLTLEDGWYVARDEETGVASQGETRPEALANLAEALKLHERSVPDEVDVDDPSSAPWL